MSSVKLGKRAEKKLTTPSINECLSSRCCEKNCIRDNLTFNFIKDLREEFYSKKQPEQSKYLAAILQNRLGPGRYKVNGKDVCRISLHILFNTAEKRLLNIQRMTASGIKDFERSNIFPIDLISSWTKSVLQDCGKILGLFWLFL